MKENYWDYPNLPKELKKKDTTLEDKLHADTTKRSWNFKKVRHYVKEVIRNLIK